ncbi:hypothetical protein BDP55DRAFT_380192 [Colletotrichum godetiae]|uniref:Uncharacterized protein n=1 Tax=Colletotrichum godetiae TaxID=1209918 RepID=A0AAJ0AT04_9PEZI|nr:uncharacterized protein BDP55DRAFT_380192 [Colletotrichum godetiae]KAK1689819.1 hypothetical protein BDP55DRAFT_380192 [Colletotrichum godetiae]
MIAAEKSPTQRCLLWRPGMHFVSSSDVTALVVHHFTQVPVPVFATNLPKKVRNLQAAIHLISFLPCLPSSAPSSSSARASMSQSVCTKEALPGG